MAITPSGSVETIISDPEGEVMRRGVAIFRPASVYGVPSRPVGAPKKPWLRAVTRYFVLFGGRSHLGTNARTRLALRRSRFGTTSLLSKQMVYGPGHEDGPRSGGPYIGCSVLEREKEFEPSTLCLGSMLVTPISRISRLPPLPTPSIRNGSAVAGEWQSFRRFARFVQS